MIIDYIMRASLIIQFLYVNRFPRAENYGSYNYSAFKCVAA
jgi:hypothetical protein